MSSFGERGQRLFWVLASALVVLVLVTIQQLPPVVASHFDAAGTPNGWSSRPIYTVLILALGVLLPLGLVGLITALTRNGPTRLNIPARDHWTRPEHGAEAVRRVRGYIWWLSCIMAATVLAMHGLIVAAHANQPPRLSTPITLIVLGAVVLAIGLWSAGWYRLLRRPPALLLLWLASGCGAGWHREELGPERRLPPRQQVQLWLGEQSRLLHAVDVAPGVAALVLYLSVDTD